MSLTASVVIPIASAAATALVTYFFARRLEGVKATEARKTADYEYEVAAVRRFHEHFGPAKGHVLDGWHRVAHRLNAYIKPDASWVVSQEFVAHAVWELTQANARIHILNDALDHIDLTLDGISRELGFLTRCEAFTAAVTWRVREFTELEDALNDHTLQDPSRVLTGRFRALTESFVESPTSRGRPVSFADFNARQDWPAAEDVARLFQTGTEPERTDTPLERWRFARLVLINLVVNELLAIESLPFRPRPNVNRARALLSQIPDENLRRATDLSASRMLQFHGVEPHGPRVSLEDGATTL